MNGQAWPSRAGLGAVLAGLLALACGGEPNQPTGRASAAIFGGELAPNDAAVVGVENFAGGQCSGSLIAPQLVLTARHCVADTEGEDLRVVCDQTPFQAPDSPGAIFVIAQPQIDDDVEDYAAVSQILMPDDVADDLCGTDEVLLVLKQPLSDVVPLVPRLEQPVRPGEAYSAVGFGVDETKTEPTAGVRRRLDGLEVACLGEDCQVGDVRSNEWIGNGGPCHGDSGGPALDSEGRVIGVVSRGKDGCGEPVFGDVATRAAWLKEQAIATAETLGIAPPSWVPCEESDTCETGQGGAGAGGGAAELPLDEPKDEHLGSTCAFSPHSPSKLALAPLLTALLLAALLLALRRKSWSSLRARAL